MKNRRKLTPRARQMFALIEKFEHSGMTRNEFCKQESVTYSTFQWWHGQYRQSKIADETAHFDTADFIPVQVAPAQRSHHQYQSHRCEIEYPGGTVLRLYGDIDPQMVLELIGRAGR